jgi:antitoxin VapB
MALSIKNEAVDRLARELAETTGETVTEAIRVAIEERLRRARGTKSTDSLQEELATIRRRCSRLPILDPRSPDEILGYDDRGVPS